MQKLSSYQNQIMQSNEHLITINRRNNELGKIYLDKKEKKTLDNEQISTLKKAMADIYKTGESQLKSSLITLLNDKNINTSTLNNEQISVIFLNGLKDLYGKYVKAEIEKANNKIKEIKIKAIENQKKIKNEAKYNRRKNKEGNSCCSIF